MEQRHSEIKERFLQYITAERRLAQRTVETYENTLKLFGEFLAALPEPRTLVEADAENIRDWMGWMMENKRSVAYVNRLIAALRTFYKFCLMEGTVDKDPARAVLGPKKPKRLPRFVREKDMDRLLQIMEEKEKTFNNVRARTIIYILYLTGMRASELLSLDDDMVDFVSREIKVTGKRNKQRIIPFGEELHNILREYIDLRDKTVERENNALFVGDKGKRMTYDKLRVTVKDNLALVSAMQKLSPHLLRHTFATSMLNHDANLESIQKLLGHQSLNATEIYTHTTFEQLKRIYNEAHPRT